VKIGDDKKAFIIILKSYAICERADVVAKMKFAGGPVTGQNALFLHDCAPEDEVCSQCSESREKGQ
jgi:putative AlgH/UPF0301 family transcriptional regulator